MNNTDTLSPTDPRAAFAAAVRTAGELIATVTPDEFALPTPCTDMDVRALLGHLVMVLDRVAALGDGANPLAVPVHTEAPEGWPALWTASAHRVQAAWADAATLDRHMVLPWAQGPGSALLATYTGELTTHTWDLATAIGRAAAWDDRALDAAWASYQVVLPAGDREARFAEVRASMPEEFRSGPPPYLNATAVADDAPLIDRIVAWTGRRV